MTAFPGFSELITHLLSYLDFHSPKCTINWVIIKRNPSCRKRNHIGWLPILSGFAGVFWRRRKTPLQYDKQVFEPLKDGV